MIFMNCEVFSCLVMYNRSRILEVDVVGFYVCDMFEFFLRCMFLEQIWFYFVLENLLYVFMDVYGFVGVFNWMMFYS